MCNVCNSNGTSRNTACGCQCANTCCCNGCGNFWNTGFQYLCRDCNGNIRVGNNGCGCQYNRTCGCQNGCGGQDTQGNVFVITGRAFLSGGNGVSAINANCDDYYARQYGLGRYAHSSCCCGTNNATFTTTTMD